MIRENKNVNTLHVLALHNLLPMSYSSAGDSGTPWCYVGAGSPCQDIQPTGTAGPYSDHEWSYAACATPACPSEPVPGTSTHFLFVFVGLFILQTYHNSYGECIS